MIVVAVWGPLYTTSWAGFGPTRCSTSCRCLSPQTGITLIFVAVLRTVGGFSGMITDAGSLYVSKAVHPDADRQQRRFSRLHRPLSAGSTGWPRGWRSDLGSVAHAGLDAAFDGGQKRSDLGLGDLQHRARSTSSSA